MARPQKDIVAYFPHDSDASDRLTLTILQAKFGNDGYAFWFRLLELLCRSGNFSYDCNPIANWEFLVAKTHLSGVSVTGILDCLASLDAIDTILWSHRVIYSSNLVSRIADVYKKRDRSLPLKPCFCNQECQHNSIPGISNPLLTEFRVTETPQSKLKETKLNNSKLKKSEDAPPSPPPPAAASFDSLFSKNGLKAELHAKFPKLDLDSELTKCSLWWANSQRKLKSPELAFRNWLEKAKAIAESSERKIPPKEKAPKSGYTGMKND